MWRKHREEERQVFPPDCFVIEKKSPNCFLFARKFVSLPANKYSLFNLQRKMKRNNYVRPAIRSVEMRHRLRMLLDSPLVPDGVQGTRDNYGSANQGMTPDKGFTIDEKGRWVWSN